MYKQALWIAKEELECDAMCVMTLMDNDKEMLEQELGFLAGDGALYYYLVNWSIGMESIKPNEMGVILV